MTDQHHDSQPWDAGLDTNFDFQTSEPHSSNSIPSSASASGSVSPPGYHIVAGTAPPHSSADAVPSTAGPDPAFDFTANAAWTDQNQFTPPLGPNDGDPLDALNLFPDNWNVPTTTFPTQNLQYRPRTDGLPQAQNPNLGLFNPFMNGPGQSPPAGPSSRPAPVAGMSTLTPAQQEQLRNIAMPPHLQYQSPKSEPSQPSPQSSTGEGHKPLSPDSKPGSRKRKSSADDDDLDDDEDEDGQQPVKKTAHNMIEKRYRTNLNDKIAALRDSVPSLRVLSKSARGEDTTEDREELHGLTPAHKLNKATVSRRPPPYTSAVKFFIDCLSLGFEQSYRVYQALGEEE